MSTKRNSLAKSQAEPKPATEIKPAADPKPTEANAATESGKAEIPDWVDETFPDHMYRLVLFECGEAGVEHIDLTRAEYIALKAHLAAMRGYRIGDVSAELLAMLAE